jgi:hypothetical protein
MRVAHHLFKKRFSTLLNEQDILAQLHPLNLSLRQLNIFLKDGVVKSEVTNRQCFQFFKDRRLTPYTAPTSHCD